METFNADAKDNKYKITWKMIKDRADSWKRYWRKNINPETIYGVPRAGEIIANCFFQEYIIVLLLHYNILHK